MIYIQYICKYDGILENTINSISPFRKGGAYFKAYIEAAYEYIKRNPDEIEISGAADNIDDLYKAARNFYTKKTGKPW